MGAAPMAFFHSLFYVLLGVIAWTLPWVAFHGLLARLHPAGYTESGTPTAGTVLALSVALATLLSIAAGFLVARLAPRRPLAHALALSLVQLALAASVQSANWSAMPAAYHAAFLGVLVPAHLLGARLGLARRPAAQER